MRIEYGANEVQTRLGKKVLLGTDEHKATCTACGGKMLNISGGVNALVRHSETEAHKGSMLQMRNQSTFKASASGSVVLCVPSKPEHT